MKKTQSMITTREGSRVQKKVLERQAREAWDRIQRREEYNLRKEQNNARIHDSRDKGRFKTGKDKRPGIYDHTPRPSRRSA